MLHQFWKKMKSKKNKKTIFMITHKEYCWHFNGRAMLKIDKNTEKNNIKKINKNIV